MSCKMISGLSEIHHKFDLFLVDQWGVLHDGFTARPGAIDALEKLKAAGGKIIILSNSGKRLDDSFARMDRLGIKPAFYDHVVTSGEQVYQHFQTLDDPFYKALGRCYYIFTWDAGNKAVISNSGKQEVDAMVDADFVLCTGTNQGNLDYYRPLLETARSRNLPMICTNPDLVSMQPDGSLSMCPGAVAKAYEDMGGTVRWHGKPDTEIYDYCKSLEPDCKRFLGIGDSLRHDILGAKRAGGSSLFILGGIHGKEKPGTDRQQCDALIKSYDIAPRYAMRNFVW